MPVFYGEFNPNGSIKTDVVVCAMTGTLIEAGDAQMGIPGTRYFVRVKASVTAHLEGQLKEQWDQVIANAPKPEAEVKADVFAFNEAEPKKAKG